MINNAWQFHDDRSISSEETPSYLTQFFVVADAAIFDFWTCGFLPFFCMEAVELHSLTKCHTDWSIAPKVTGDFPFSRWPLLPSCISELVVMTPSLHAWTQPVYIHIPNFMRIEQYVASKITEIFNMMSAAIFFSRIWRF
jgi:hypothetical protein